MFGTVDIAAQEVYFEDSRNYWCISELKQLLWGQ